MFTPKPEPSKCSCRGTPSRRISSKTMPKPKGVSVYYLRHFFLKEICAEGYSEESTLEELETWICETSAQVLSLSDGLLGASHVACLKGNRIVGPASIRLSCAVEIGLKEVITTLESFCESKDWNTKETFVWIDTLCQNLHRKESHKKRSFQNVFRETVIDNMASIGHTIVILSPWDKPVYLLKINCLLELYSAYLNPECELTIVLPPEQHQDLFENLDEMAEFFAAITNIHVETFEKQVGKNNQTYDILRWIEQEVGYSTFNSEIDALLRTWILLFLQQSVVEEKEALAKGTDDEKNGELPLHFALLCDNVGIIMDENGQYEKALEYFQQSHTIYLDVYGEEHEEIAEHYKNVATVSAHAGKYDESLQGIERSLEILSHLQNNPSTNNSLANLHNNAGNVFRMKGDLDEAFESFRKGLSFTSNWKDNALKGTLYLNIGNVLEKKGDSEEALKAYFQASKFLKDDKSTTAFIKVKVGNILESEKDLAGASIQYHSALQIQNNIFGASSAPSASTINRIGMLLKSAGKLDEALVEMKRALEIRLKVLGTNNIATAESFHHIASLLHQKGDLKGALTHHRKSQYIYKNISNKDNESLQIALASTSVQLGNVLYQMGSLNGAMVEYHRALKIQLKVLSQDHHHIATTYNNIGNVLTKKGDPDGALIHLLKALKIKISTLGENNESIAATLNNIGAVRRAKGDLNGALHDYRRAFEIYHAVLGENNISASTTRLNIGNILHQQGLWDDALIEYRLALKTKIKVLGDHSSTATTHINIGNLLLKKNELDSSLVEYNSALEILNKMHGSSHTKAAKLRAKIDFIAAQRNRLPEWVGAHKV